MIINVSQSERAKRLLKAAEVLFLKNGYTATSLQMLIDQAGGSRRTIYSEFENKEGLFKAVLRQKAREVILTLSDVSDVDQPRASLIKVCHLFLTKLLEPDMVTFFKLLINAIQDIPDIGDMLYQHALVDGPEGLVNYLLQLDDIGTIKIINPQHASHLLLGMVKGHLHTHALLDSSYRPSEQQISMQVEEAVDIFLNGVLT